MRIRSIRITNRSAAAPVSGNGQESGEGASAYCLLGACYRLTLVSSILLAAMRTFLNYTRALIGFGFSSILATAAFIFRQLSARKKIGRSFFARSGTKSQSDLAGSVDCKQVRDTSASATAVSWRVGEMLSELQGEIASRRVRALVFLSGALPESKAAVGLTVHALEDHLRRVTSMLEVGRADRSSYSLMEAQLCCSLLGGLPAEFRFGADGRPIRFRLDRLSLKGIDLQGLDLRASSLRGSDLSRCELSGSLLDGADLRDARLCQIVGVRTSFSRALMERADFSDAVLVDVDFTGALLTSATFDRVAV